MPINTSLLSVGQATDAGCVAIFTKEKVLICDEHDVNVSLIKPALLEGARGRNGLWHVSLLQPQRQPILHCANSAYTQSTMADLATYLHACAGYPVTTTWISAIQAGNFRSWPHLSAHSGPAWIRKHLPKQITTTMGHMKATRQNSRSTKQSPPPVEPLALAPPRSHTSRAQSHEVIACGVVDLRDNHAINGLVCSDLPGRFPITSSKGNNYIFILYDCDSNVILSKAIKSREKHEIVSGYQQCYDELKAANITPVLHRLDNEVSKDLFAAITANACKYQLVTAYDHRQNLAERAIQTFKNHFISVLHGTDSAFPAHLWCRLLPQVNIQINLLRQSRINPRRSAYAELQGHFDFNSTPLAILGSVAVIFETVQQRTTSYADHGKRGWYIGPSMLKYRNYSVYVTGTKGERDSNRVDFFPPKCRLPNSNDATRLAAALEDLRHELRPRPFDLMDASHGTPLNRAVRTLKTLLQAPLSSARATLSSALPPAPTPRVAAAPAPRVELDNSPPRTPGIHEARGRYSPGTAISKVWNGIRYHGTVVSDNGRWYTARYTDGDVEDYTHSELTKLLATANSIQFTNGWGYAYGALVATAEAQFTTMSNILSDSSNRAFAITHPDTGKQLEYRHLLRDPLYTSIWQESAANEFGRLAQGIGRNPDGTQRIKGTNTFFFIPKHKVPKGRIVTYARFVCTYRPDKEEKNRTRLTVGGNLLTDYAGDVSTDTAGLELIKMHWQSVLSTPNARYMTMDISNFYLNTALDRFEYMRIALADVPQTVIDEYKLHTIATNGYVYVEIRRALFGLKQSGMLANKQLSKVLNREGYHAARHTPGLWLHKTRPISFTLVVDDFGVKYVNKLDVVHLQSVIERAYPTTTDWTGTKFIGVTLKWDYGRRQLRASMPGYVRKALLQFQHEIPPRLQQSPSKYISPVYGSKAPQMTKIDESPSFTKADGKRLEQVCGKFLYYSRIIDDTMAHVLNGLSTKTRSGTLNTNIAVAHFLDYCASNPDATKLYKASDMILSIDSDAAYLVEPEARSRAGGFIYLGNRDGKLINGSIHVLAKVIKNVVSSASEAELAALFMNARLALPLRVTLEELGHKQPATRLKTDNSTANGIINGTIKQNRSKGIDMRYYWLVDRVQQGQFEVYWAPGACNLADYFTKHHPPPHHKALRPIYLFDPDQQPDMQGCIKILTERSAPKLRARTAQGDHTSATNRLTNKLNALQSSTTTQSKLSINVNILSNLLSRSVSI